MGIKTYNDAINLSLLGQMKDLIMRINNNKHHLGKVVSLFGDMTFKIGMEETYGLRYPGEVLERYREKCGDTLENLRALAIALAEMRDKLDNSMFTGGQKMAFISLIRSRADRDIYLQGSLYMLTDRKVEKTRLENRLKQYTPCTSSEFFYLQSVLLEDADGYEPDLKQYCFFLGAGRTMKAYGNENIFAWFLTHFMQSIKSYRKKDCRILKALAQLPFHHIKKGSTYWDNLFTAGYSEQEIIFLNMRLPSITSVEDCLHKDSITMERIVAHGCQHIMNVEEVEDPLLYEQVVELLFLYEEFDRNIDGCGGLTLFLTNKVTIKDIGFFLYLYNRKRERVIHDKWLLINLIEDRWDELPQSLTKEQYIDLFESSFCRYSEKSEVAWMERYERINGESYTCQFWKKMSKYSKAIFKKLVRAGIINMVSYLEQYAEEEKIVDRINLNEKWRHMLSHLAEVANKMDCHEIFCFWESYERLYGMEALRSFLRKKSIITDTVCFRVYSYYGATENFWIGLDYLTRDEQRKLFFWECEELYLHYPKYYNRFLIKFLEKKASDLFPKEQCRVWLDAVIARLNPRSYQTEKLRNMYYRKDELDEYKKQQKYREEEEKNIQLQEWRHEIQKGMADADGALSRLGIWRKNVSCYNTSKRYYEVAYSCLLEELEKGNCQVECKQIGYIIEAMISIMNHGVVNWHELRDLIMKLEVKEDESK